MPRKSFSPPAPVRGFDVTLHMEIPTATHHAKKIIRPKGVRRAMLMDDPDLVRARERYRLQLLLTGRRPSIPLDGPIGLEVTFCFADARGPWYPLKPDASNLIKTLEDCLVRSGWIKCDQRVCKLSVQKVTGPKPFIRIVARELGCNTGAVSGSPQPGLFGR